MQDEHREPRPVAGLGVLQHLLVAGRIAEGRVRPAAYHQVDAFGFATVVVVEQQLGVLGQERFAILVIAICRAAHGADDLFRRDAIGLLGIHAHEILAAAGADVSLVAVRSKILQHLLHRLVGQFVVRLVPARVFGFGEPLFHLGLELFRGHARERGHQDFFKVWHGEFPDGLAVAGNDGLERLNVFQFRFFFHERTDPVKAIHHLGIHRMLDPERAVLVERGDAFLGRDKIRAAGFRGRFDKVHDGLFRRAVVPRGKRVLGLGVSEAGESDRQQGDGLADGFHGFSSLQRTICFTGEVAGRSDTNRPACFTIEPVG